MVGGRTLTGMKLSPAALIEHAKSPEGRKKIRYAGVSVVFVPLGLVSVQILGAVFGGNYTLANFVSASVLTLPNLFANKLYVWKVTTKENLRTQILVFWVAAILGLLLSALFIYTVQVTISDDAGLFKRAAVMAGQLGGYGIVWVARFLVLDRWLFKVTHGGAEPAPEEIEEFQGEIPI
jgi:putative flippase GtrA